MKETLILSGKTAEIRQCTPEDLPQILQMQEKTIAELTNKDILRKNTEETLLACLNPPHYTLGVFLDDTLIAFSVLFFPGDSDENLAFPIDAEAAKESANYKLVIVDSAYRGHGLQCCLADKLEEKARAYGVKILCATVSPYNPHSKANIIKCGYSFFGYAKKYGNLEREIYYKYL